MSFADCNNDRLVRILRALLVISIASSSVWSTLDKKLRYNFFCKDGQNLMNAQIVSETDTEFEIKLEYLEETKKIRKADLSSSPLVAHSLKASPHSGVRVRKMESVAIYYSENVTGANLLQNYLLSGEAVGTLKIAEVIAGADNSNTLKFSGNPVDGVLRISIKNVTNSVGVPIGNSLLEYTFDVTAPRVQVTPAPGGYINATDEIVLKFSEPVSGADSAGNYNISGKAARRLKLRKIESRGENSWALLLDGKPAEGELLLEMRQISDLVGNPLAQKQIAYTVDLTPPEFEIFPKSKTTLSKLANATVKFSEAMVNNLQVDNYVLKGSGVGTLKILKVAGGPGNSVVLTFAGTPTNGEIQLSLASLRDNAGNGLKTAEVEYLADVTVPTVSALPASGTRQRALQKINLEYSEEVMGFAGADLVTISGAGKGSLEVSKVWKTDAKHLEIQLNGQAADGPVNVTLPGVNDPAGNKLPETLLTYEMDTTAPLVTATPSMAYVRPQLENITLDFSEPVVGANKVAAYSLSGNGAGNLRIAKVTSVGDRSVALTLTGNPADGKVSLQISGVTDAVGNPLRVSGIEYAFDVTSPEMIYVTPTRVTAVRSMEQIEIEFSEPIAGAYDAQHFTMSGPGSGTLKIKSVEMVSETRCRLMIEGSAADGDINIEFHEIADFAGNVPTQRRITFLADTQRPDFQSTPPTGTVVGAISRIEFRYSKPVIGADDMKKYRIQTKSGKTIQIRSITALGSNTYVLETQEKLPGGAIRLELGGITDKVGNPLVHNTVEFHSDQTPPSARIITTSTKPLNALGEIAVRFSEPVVAADSQEYYSLTGEGLGSLRIAGVIPQTDNSVVLKLTGQPTSGTIALKIQGIKDTYGNAMPAQITNFAIDTKPPTYHLNPAAGTPLRNLSRIEVLFDEDIADGIDISHFSLGGPGKGELRITGVTRKSPRVLALTLSGNPVPGELEFHVSGITDLAGNQMPPGKSVYLADNQLPEMAIDPASGTVLNRLANIVIQFSEPVSGADDLNHYEISGPGAGDLRIAKIRRVDTQKVELILSGAPENGKVDLAFSGIRDAAGNKLKNDRVAYILDLVPPTVISDPGNASTLTALEDVSLQFSKQVVGADQLTNYHIKSEFPSDLKIAGVESAGKNRYRLHFSGSVAGKVWLRFEKVTDQAGNAPNQKPLQYRIELPTLSQPCGDAVH
jgi:hypothetical protein